MQTINRTLDCKTLNGQPNYASKFTPTGLRTVTELLEIDEAPEQNQQHSGLAVAHASVAPDARTPLIPNAQKHPPTYVRAHLYYAHEDPVAKIKRLDEVLNHLDRYMDSFQSTAHGLIHSRESPLAHIDTEPTADAGPRPMPVSDHRFTPDVQRPGVRGVEKHIKKLLERLDRAETAFDHAEPAVLDELLERQHASQGEYRVFKVSDHVTYKQQRCSAAVRIAFGAALNAAKEVPEHHRTEYMMRCMIAALNGAERAPRHLPTEAAGGRATELRALQQEMLELVRKTRIGQNDEAVQELLDVGPPQMRHQKHNGHLKMKRTLSAANAALVRSFTRHVTSMRMRETTVVWSSQNDSRKKITAGDPSFIDPDSSAHHGASYDSTKRHTLTLGKNDSKHVNFGQPSDDGESQYV